MDGNRRKDGRKPILFYYVFRWVNLPTYFLIAASKYTYYTKRTSANIIKTRKSALNNFRKDSNE